MVGDNSAEQRISQLEQMQRILTSQLHEALAAMDEAQRLVEHCKTHHGNAEPAPALESVLDAALRVPDVYRAISALMVRSESWAHTAISKDLFEAFRRRQDEG